MGAIDHELISIPATTAEVGLSEAAVEALVGANSDAARIQGTKDHVRQNTSEGSFFGDRKVGDRTGDPEKVRLALRTLMPRRSVTVRAFQIDRTRVSNRQYEVFMRETGRSAPPTWPDGRIPAGEERHAVTNVSHKDAFSYATWAGLELLAENEWQVAAGAADGRRYPWGDELPPLLEELRVKPAASFAVDAHPELASPFGVLGLISNHWEWCHDAFGPLPGGDEAAFRATYPNHQSFWRALRGGHTYTQQWGIHARRGADPATTRMPYGFRCVRRD